MLSTKTLKLETVPGNVSDRPRAVHFEAGVGDEIIDFEPAVFLEGKVSTGRYCRRGILTTSRQQLAPFRWHELWSVDRDQQLQS